MSIQPWDDGLGHTSAIFRLDKHIANAIIAGVCSHGENVPRKIPDDLIRYAAQLIDGGAKLKDAASLVGCNSDELSKKLRAIGVSPNRRRDWNADGDQIVALYESGLGTTAIAERLGAPRHSAGNVRDVLIRRGIMRDRSSANLERFAREPAEVKRANVAKARNVRMRNLVAMSEKRGLSTAIGIGEYEIADILTNGGIAVRRQVVIANNYLIDIAAGHIAIEVKSAAISAHVNAVNAARFKEVADSGYALVFVVVNHIPTLMRHADDLIAAIKAAQANPPSRGEYWVVRCSLEQIGADMDVDHWSIERRTPKHGRSRF